MFQPVNFESNLVYLALSLIVFAWQRERENLDRCNCTPSREGSSDVKNSCPNLFPVADSVSWDQRCHKLLPGLSHFPSVLTSRKIRAVPEMILVQRTVCLILQLHIDSRWRKLSGTLFIQHFGLLPGMPDAAAGKPSVYLHLLPVWPVLLGELCKSELARMSPHGHAVFKFCSPSEGISSFLHRSICSSPSLLSSSPLGLINTSSHVLQVCRFKCQQSLGTVIYKRAQSSPPNVLLMGLIYYMWYIS